MSEPYAVKPDKEFLDRVLDEGGEDLKKCYQCATCSVVCELSTGRKAFPRKEMIWAQWGLKDRIVADPDVWVCHQCNDCSTRCPRGARPGDVLAALRRASVEHFAIPRPLATWVNQYKYLPLVLLVVPAILLGLALVVRGPVEAMIPFGEHHGFYARLFPHWLLIGFFTGFTTLTFLAAAAGVFRFWKGMQAADAAAGANGPVLGIVPSLVRVVLSILKHDRFGQCESQASRRLAHLLAFYGFAALFVVTVWAVIDLYVMPFLGVESLYPFGLIHPMKILANIGCAILIFGCIKAINDRLARQETSGASTSFDWLFVGLLLAVGVSGLLTEIFRFAVDPGDHAPLGVPQHMAFAIYFVHLVLVFDLLVYLPYSKFAHIVYRTAAMVYAEYSGRSVVSGQAGS